MSRSDVAGPRLGATPVSTHALRFWYIRPRVPSIGSTMIHQSADASSRPLGIAAAAARQPLRDEHERVLARERLARIASTTASPTTSIA